MLNIGCHLSSSKGFLAMGRTALAIGASTFQFFTRNPRGGSAKGVDPQDVAAFLALAGDNGLGPFLAHAAYTLNPCSADAKTRTFALESMRDDWRSWSCAGQMYNFHPGIHVGRGWSRASASTPPNSTRHAAGDEDDSAIKPWPQGQRSGDRLGNCGGSSTGSRCRTGSGRLDTCLVHEAGYDIVHDLTACCGSSTRPSSSTAAGRAPDRQPQPPRARKDATPARRGAHRAAGLRPHRQPSPSAASAFLSGNAQRAARVRARDRPAAGHGREVAGAGGPVPCVAFLADSWK